VSVLDQLVRLNKARPDDAAAWFHRGDLAMWLMRNVSGRMSAGLYHADLMNHAWDAFRKAVALEPNNAKYWASLAKYYAMLGTPKRKDADSAFAKAKALSRTHGDTALLAELLVDSGIKEWSLYSRLSGRGFVSTGAPSYMQDESRTGGMHYFMGEESVWRAAENDTVKELPRLLKSAIENVTRNASPRSFDQDGASAVLRSAHDLGEAHDLAPSNPRAYRSLATLYAARGGWEELASLAGDRTRREPSDPWGWMALGLSFQRMHASSAAESALEKGFAGLPPADRAWLDRVDRILDPRDSVKYANATAASRAETARLLWQQADPLWAADDETPRVEFLARLVFAELRWSDSTRHIHGADTRLGELYVRYGPADNVVANFWIYNSGLIFAVNTGNSRYDVPARPDREADDQDVTERIRRWQPSRWDNISLARIDSMPTQVVRFRQDADSIDVFLATRAPIAELRKVTAKNQQAVAHYWLNSRDGTTKLADSLVLGGTGDMQFTRRVPSGPYYYRVESIVPGALIAGRTAASMMMGPDTTGFASTGFGMSDVLVASSVAPRGTASRWSDFDVAPVLGDVAQGSSVAFVWENYDLGQKDGRATYTLTISLERKWKMFLNRIRARIVNSWAAMRGIEQTSERVVFTYDRTVAHAPVIADYITLDLADTPAGNYDVTVDITDNGTGRSTSRTMRVVIRE
jgi:tetratricopeptide (TPR) repeat protein